MLVRLNRRLPRESKGLFLLKRELFELHLPSPVINRRVHQYPGEQIDRLDNAQGLLTVIQLSYR